MRIDFAQLDKQIQDPPFSRPIFEQSLATLWQHDEKVSLKRLQSQKQDYENNSINFEVKFPYEVSRSLSPQSIKKQMMYLKAKQILPSATVNYIQQKLTNRTDIKAHQSYEETQFQQTPQRHLHSYYFDTSLNLTKSKCSKQNSPSTNIKQLCTRTKKRAQMKADKILKATQQILADKKRKQINELTLRPILNYTMNSKASKQINRKRKDHFNATSNSVFQSLYNDAVRYQSKRQIQRLKIKEQLMNYQSNRRKSKINVYTTFEERLLRSLESSAERKKNAHNKQEVDYSTGKKLFVPDTHLSKLTYYSHFKSTETIGVCHGHMSPARDQHYAQESKKLNRSQEDITTTLNLSHQDLSQYNSKPEKQETLPTIPGKRLERLAELYADLIWEEGVLRKENLNQAEERVLGQFMQALCKFEYSAAVSRQVFLALFKDYVGKINLFDKEILFRRLKKQQTNRNIPINTSRCTFGKKKPATSNIKAPDHNGKVYFV